MVEQWEKINEYDNYSVSSYGRVRNDKYNGRIKRLTITKDGYRQVRLSKDGEAKTFLVHRLVAEAFIPNPDNLETVDHIINVREGGDDRADNLQWLPRASNASRYKTGGTTKQYTLEGELVAEFPSISAAARSIGYTEGAVRAAIKNNRNCAGYKWERS